jgi:hypothetical protein
MRAEILNRFRAFVMFFLMGFAQAYGRVRGRTPNKQELE